MVRHKDGETRAQYLARALWAWMQIHEKAAECEINTEGGSCDGAYLADTLCDALDVKTDYDFMGGGNGRQNL